MKIVKKSIRLAMINTLFEFYTIKEFASAIAEAISKKYGSAEVHTTKKRGFSIRCKADVEEDAIIKTLVKTIRSFLDDKYDEVLDYVADNYEIAYDSDMIDTDLVSDIFDISTNGRLIIIDIDS